MHEERGKGMPQRLSRQRLTALEQEALIEMIERAIHGEEPLLDWRQRECALDEALLCRSAFDRAGDLCQLVDGLVLEELPHREPDSLLGSLRDHLDRLDRVTPEL